MNISEALIALAVMADQCGGDTEGRSVADVLHDLVHAISDDSIAQCMFNLSADDLR
jgi:hypothetical protein